MEKIDVFDVQLPDGRQIVRQFPFRVNPPCLKTKELKQSYLLNLGGRLDNFLKKRLYAESNL